MHVRLQTLWNPPQPPTQALTMNAPSQTYKLSKVPMGSTQRPLRGRWPKNVGARLSFQVGRRVGRYLSS